MSAVGITENVKGDVKKFEIWHSGREVVYIVQVSDFLFVLFCTFNRSHTPVSHDVSCSLCVCLGFHSGGQSCMADGDSKNSHQPTETTSRFIFAALNQMLPLCFLLSLTEIV